MLERDADQAQGLRRLFARPALRVLPIASDAAPPAGEAVDGFARLVLSLAATFERLGHRPLVLDADRGRLAPAAGLAGRRELLHVLAGECTLDAAFAAARGAAGPALRPAPILPAARGLDSLAGVADAARLFSALAGTSPGYDLAILVAPVARLAHALGELPEVLLVTGRDAGAARRGYACVKTLHDEHGTRRVHAIELGRSGTAGRIADVAGRFLSLEVRDAGSAGPAGGLPPALAQRLLDAVLPAYEAAPPHDATLPADDRRAAAFH